MFLWRILARRSAHPQQEGASIGISLYPENADDPVVLLDLAYRAMYRAKANGQGCSEFAVSADLPVGA